MLLAEALNERKQVLDKIKSRTVEIPAELVVEENEAADTVRDVSPAVEIADLFDRWQELTHQIQDANQTALVDLGGDHTSMLNAITQRDRLALQHQTAKRIYDTVQSSIGRGDRNYGISITRDTIKKVSLVPVAKLRAEVDELAENIRLLDLAIQRVNWTQEV